MEKKSSVFYYGNIKHNPIVFIHGFPFDNCMWEDQVENLSREFYCIAYDLRGLGAAPPEGGQFTIEDFVDDLEEIISSAGIKKPVLCGLSMGGYIALRAIERNENLYSGLILCDTKSEADDNTGKLKRSQALKKINKEGIQKFAEAFVTPLFAPGSIERLGDKFIKILGKSMNSDPVGVKGCILAMASRTDTTDYLSKIKIPVLVMGGKDDPLTPPEQMEKLAKQIKGCEFHVIENAGHLPPVEQPEIVNKLLNNFVKKIKEL